MGDIYTCIAVANIYSATVKVHIGLEDPILFTHYMDGGGVSSGGTGAELSGGLQEILLADDGPASQSSQDGEGIEFHQQVHQQNHQQVQQQHPRSEELEILDEKVLHLPYGSMESTQEGSSRA